MYQGVSEIWEVFRFFRHLGCNGDCILRINTDGEIAVLFVE